MVAEPPPNLDLVRPTKPRSFLRPRPSFARVTLADVKAIADIVAQRFTETEACNVIGLPVATWKDYKGRHLQTITDIFNKAKTSQLIGHVANIQRFESKDWRASRELLAMKDPSRFGKAESSQVATGADSALVALVTAALDRVYGNTGALAPGVATKVLVDAPQGSGDEPSANIVDVDSVAQLPVDTNAPQQALQPEGVMGGEGI